MYFDPGTGSMIIQAIIAALASVGAMLILFKNNIINFFKKDKKNEKTNGKSKK